MANDFRIEGLEPAMKKLRDLPAKLARGALRRTGTKAMKPVRDTARALAARFDDPESASNIPKKIVTRAGSRRSERDYGGGAVVTKVGVEGGARARNVAGDTGHWRHLEFGTEDTAAQPFMRPALEGNVSRVTEIYVASLSAEIDKAIR